MIALSQVALDVYVNDLMRGGILIFDPEAIRSIPHQKEMILIEVPTSEIAQKIGGVTFQNLAALGALSTQIDWVSYTSFEWAIADCVPSKTLAKNLAALKSGRDYVNHRYQVRKG